MGIRVEVKTEDLRVYLGKAPTVGAFVKVAEVLVNEAARGCELGWVELAGHAGGGGE